MTQKSHKRVSSTPGSVIGTSVICIQVMARVNGIPFSQQKILIFSRTPGPIAVKLFTGRNL
jgi:hypothetical protein